MIVQAEVSLYPLKTAEVTPLIADFIARLEAAGLAVEPGPLGTQVSGEAEALFAALGSAYAASAGQAACALVIKALALPG